MLANVEMSPRCGQSAQSDQTAPEFEHTGQGNMNVMLGSGNIYTVGSGGVVNQYRGQFHYPNISSTRDALDSWLNRCGDLQARQSNDYAYDSHANEIQEGTGKWLFDEPAYEEWAYIPSPSASATYPNVLWVDGDAGFGKSVLCAHSIRQMRDLWEGDSEVAVTYQFYKMGNESEAPMTACLILAKMLFEQRFKVSDKVPDEIMGITAHSPSDPTQLRKLIELLVREFKAVFIFVDGLDEMTDSVENIRWSRAKDFLRFILRLAVGARSPKDDFDTVVKVWLSSQSRRQISQVILSSIPANRKLSTASSPNRAALAQIHLTQELNQSDISAMFRSEMTLGGSNVTLYSGGVSKVLEVLQLAVKGNFLWARLMIDSIAKANNLEQAIEASRTVPEDFRTYLGNRIKAQLEKHPQSRKDAAQILSCLLYAQRPILDDELCDAVCAARIATPGQNVREQDRLFKDKIEDICAPLVKVDRMNRDGKIVVIYTIYHSAVRKFLHDTPNILVPDRIGDPEPGDENYIVTPEVLGRACMRYLQQKRYKRPLLCPAATDGTGFLTACEEKQNIGTHPFLTYCGKYWARHKELEHTMGNHSQKRCDEIYEFVSSSHFRTTLQVQSLFVESQFRFMLYAAHEEAGIHLVRAFPNFFTEPEKYPQGNKVQKQYNEAIGEFGYYLDSWSSFSGELPGQIDRCCWGMLGESNMFHRVSSRLKSFKLETIRTPDDDARYMYHDNVIMRSQRMAILSVSSCSTGNSIILEPEIFEIKPGKSPEHIDGDVGPMEVMVEKLELYRRPLREHFPGRPSTILVSSDGQVLRVGSELFVGEGVSFKQLDLNAIPPRERMDFFEEVGSRGPWVALGRRRNITPADLANLIQACEDTLAPDKNEKMDACSSSGFSDRDSEENGSDSEDNGPVGSVEDHGPGQLPHADNQQITEDEATESDLETADNNSTCCSARDSCSLRSTPTQSDEIGHDDDFWNDWFSDDEDLDIVDITDDNINIDSDVIRIHQSLEELFEENTIAQTFDENQGGSDIASYISAGDLDEQWSISDESDTFASSFPDERWKWPSPGSTGVAGAKNKATANLCELLVLNTDRGALAPPHSSHDDVVDESTAAEENRASLRVFRFVCKSSGLLFSSPPAIHPRHNLLVWPLCGDEILFAHFSPPDKSFFTARLGSGSGRRTCQISMQAKFSPCGRYLHIASLDVAVPECVDAEDRPTVQIENLELQISTYRLSARKPERSLPRLVYSTSCPLETPNWHCRDGSDNDGLTPLPWTLTWEWDDGEGGAHVYACQSSPFLRVVRAPLFADVEKRERVLDGLEAKDQNDALAAFTNVQRVFLPLSARCRRVQFFPHSSGSTSSAKPDPFVATVVVSAEDARNPTLDHARGLANEYRGPAQVSQLKKSQFGDWKRIQYSEIAPNDKVRMRRPSRVETWRGQLLSKYEKFDMRDDRDIVPYTGIW